MKTARLPSNVIPCRPEHIVYLVKKMREDERAQFIALSGLEQFDEDAAVRWFIEAAHLSGVYAVTVLQDDDLPAAAGGFQPAGPGVWQAWMLGSEQGWSEQWRSLTKGTRWLMDRIFESGAHRLQTSAITSREHAIEWFERSLGFKAEGVWRHYGIRGEDVAHFSRLRGE
ncbi:hypothetical protein [Stenotrophomonas pictorum]|uniref:hypothetical protein n=1 Tax=Stenotrophomonas pictorum TaxID=86184 RepID=UPI000A5729F2|nr:hypothetical protein [Stenotrophomonas pictorum]